jgi:hypothetical protein
MTGSLLSCGPRLCADRPQTAQRPALGPVSPVAPRRYPVAVHVPPADHSLPCRATLVSGVPYGTRIPRRRRFHAVGRVLAPGSLGHSSRRAVSFRTNATRAVGLQNGGSRWGWRRGETAISLEIAGGRTWIRTDGSYGVAASLTFTVISQPSRHKRTGITSPGLCPFSAACGPVSGVSVTPATEMRMSPPRL